MEQETSSEKHFDHENSYLGTDQIKSNKNKPDVRKTVWRNVFILIFFHISAIYGFYLAVSMAKWQTNVFAAVLYVLSKVGMGAGVHRLWSHRSYRATLPMRVLLMLFFTTAYEGKIWFWARDHRVHHKHQETEADPYNAAEGLWFSHVGWLLKTKHPMVIEKGKTIDVNDLRADPVVMFQKRYYWQLLFLLCFLLPTWLPAAWWGERKWVSWHVAVFLRCVVSFHGTWVINSIAHTYGNRPYDKNIMATQSGTTTWLTLGEGWHNYHHAFPWDYRTSEMGLSSFNLTKGFIDLCSRIGWAHDLRVASPAVVAARALRTGDGSRRSPRHDVAGAGAGDEVDVWGWGDLELSENQRLDAIVKHRRRGSVDVASF